MSKQTAVDYLFEKLCGENGYVDTYYMDVVKKIEAIYEQAKAMEREQHKDTWFDSTSQFDNASEMTYKKDFEDYYNEIYKGGEQ